MKNITKSAENEVILESEWSQHKLHQQRLRWAELGQKFGEHIDNAAMRMNAKTVNIESAELECCA